MPWGTYPYTVYKNVNTYAHAHVYAHVRKHVCTQVLTHVYTNAIRSVEVVEQRHSPTANHCPAPLAAYL